MNVFLTWHVHNCTQNTKQSQLCLKLKSAAGWSLPLCHKFTCFKISNFCLPCFCDKTITQAWAGKDFFVSTKYNCLRHAKSCYISSTRSLNMTWCSSCDHQQICLLILEEHTWSVIHLLMCPAVHMYEKEYFWAKTWLSGWYHSL